MSKHTIKTNRINEVNAKNKYHKMKNSSVIVSGDARTLEQVGPVAGSKVVW